MGWFFVPRILAAAMMIVMLVLLTRLLGAEQFARYNIAITIGAVGFAFVFGWLASSMQRFHNAREFEGKATAVIMGLFLRVMLVLIVITVLVGLFFPVILDKFIILAFVYFLAHSMHEMGLSGLRVLHLGPKFALAVILRPVIVLALMLVILLMFDATYEDILISISFAATLLGVFSLVATIRKIGIAKPRADFAKKFFIFGAPLAFVGGTTMIISLVAQFVVVWGADLTAVGVYAAAHTLAMRTINMPMEMLGRSLAATVYQSYEESGEFSASRHLERYSSFLLFISVPTVIILFFGNDTIATLLFGSALSEGIAPHLPILAVAAFMYGIQGGLFSYAFTITRRTGAQAIIIISSTGLHAVLALILINLLGPIGVSYALLIAACTSLVVVIIYGRRLFKVSIPREHIIKLVPAVIALSLSAIIADEIRSVTLSVGVIGLGMAVFLLILYLQKYLAMQRIVNKTFAVISAKGSEAS